MGTSIGLYTVLAKHEVLLCPVDALHCPRCEHRIYRTALTGAHMTLYCSARLSPGTSCNTHLFALRSDREALAVVTAITADAHTRVVAVLEARTQSAAPDGG